MYLISQVSKPESECNYFWFTLTAPKFSGVDILDILSAMYDMKLSKSYECNPLKAPQTQS